MFRTDFLRGEKEVLKFFFKRIRKNQRGNALIEFALVIPILLLLVMGIIEFGYIFNGYIILTGAAREGARVAVVGKTDEISEKVINHTAGSYIKNVQAQNPVLGEVGEETIVTVTGTIPMLTGFFDFLGDSLTLSTQATMRQQVAPTD